MPIDDGDDEVFYGDEFTVEATVGAETVAVHFVQPDEDLLGDTVRSRQYLMRYPASAFPGLARGDTVTIVGATYTVRDEPRLLRHGRDLEAELSKN